MNNIGRYTINLKKSKTSLVEDETTFIEELETIGVVGYEFPHFFEDKNITGFRASVIETLSYPHIEEIQALYGISPNKIYESQGVYHLIFYFKKALNKYDYRRVSTGLAYIYMGVARKYHFYPIGGVVERYSNEDVYNILDTASRMYFLLQEHIEHEKAISISEYKIYEDIQNIPIKDVIRILYQYDVNEAERVIAGVDEKKNIHITYGFPFSLVDKYYGVLAKTKDFFNNKFQTSFSEGIEFEESSRVKNGVMVEGGSLIYKDDKGYYWLDEQDNKKRLSDFVVKVYAKIAGRNGKFHFIVKLINPKEGIETQKILWENKSSPSIFADFIQSYGAFHFYGGTSYVKELHRLIASTKRVPEIKQVIGYGAQDKHGIILFKNGVWDIKERVFSEKTDMSDDFYYNYNGDGFWVTDKQDNNLSDILSTGVPILNTDRVIPIKQILNLMEKLYADNSGTYLFLTLMGMMGYMLYGDKEKNFPLIFTRGVTGSGKTAYNQILQRAWGMKKAAADFSNSTLFSMTVTLSYLIKLPYFLTEYRENSPNREAKVGMIRSVFDKTHQNKGRADQSIVKYDYFAMPVFDGEEMIDDGALRTRSLQTQLIKKHKISGSFTKILREEGDIIDNILFTYLSKSNGEKYVKYIDKGFEIFKPTTTDHRIAENLAYIYAGCMCFNSSKENQELYINILQEVANFQQNDFLKNSTSMQIVKVLGRFCESSYSGIFPGKDNVIISWNALSDYVARYRIGTTLKLDTYKEHLEGMGFLVDYYDVGFSMVEGVLVDYERIPKSMLVNTGIYESYTNWKKIASKIVKEIKYETIQI